MKKDLTRINIDKDKIINLYIGKGTESRNIIKMIKMGIQNPFKYFNTIKKISFDIELIYSRKEIDGILGSKTPNWLIASSFKNKFIIFDPSKIEKYTCHNKNEFEQLITHETTHILLKKLNSNLCDWMNEGLALNIAKQEKRKDIKAKNINYFIKNCLFKNSKYETFISKQGYNISYRLIRFLLANYDKKTMLKLFKIEYKSNKSAEKDVCRVLSQNKNKLIDQFTKILKIHE